LGRKEKQIMKSKIVVVLLVTFVTAAAAFAATPINGQKPERGLVGTWVTTVAPPPEAEAPPFKLILSFLSDHNLIATGAGGEFPALGNPCLGTWARNNDNEYTITYVCLDFDANLQLTGMDKLTGKVTPNDIGGTLSGSIALTNFDAGGQEVFSACCANVGGERLEVEDFAKVSGSAWRAPRLRK
jgi:hypothetical protein